MCPCQSSPSDADDHVRDALAGYVQAHKIWLVHEIQINMRHWKLWKGRHQFPVCWPARRFILLPCREVIHTLNILYMQAVASDNKSNQKNKKNLYRSSLGWKDTHCECCQGACKTTRPISVTHNRGKKTPKPFLSFLWCVCLAPWEQHLLSFQGYEAHAPCLHTPKIFSRYLKNIGHITTSQLSAGLLIHSADPILDNTPACVRAFPQRHPHCVPWHASLLLFTSRPSARFVFSVFAHKTSFHHHMLSRTTQCAIVVSV